MKERIFVDIIIASNIKYIEKSAWN